MYELLYTSLAVEDVTEVEVTKILEASQPNNEKNSITGMLVYTQNEYVQLLEGERQAVKDLYKKISQDKRHRQARIFYEGDIRERSFGEWSMISQSLKAAANENKEISELVEKNKPIYDFSKNPNTGKRLFMMLRDFI